MTEPADMTRQAVVYRMPGTEDVVVRRDVEYFADSGGPRLFDVYLPPGPQVPRGAVVFVSGYPDPGMERMVGRKLKDWTCYQDWGRLVAASGLVGITYTNVEPVADLGALLAHLHGTAADLGIARERVGLWACSGNVPNALAALMRQALAPRCAVLAYGYMLDCAAATEVASAASQFHFVNPPAGKSVADLPVGSSLLVVRAGGDVMPGLNASIDRFVGDALARDLPITLVNYPGAPHAFDIADDSAASREVIRGMLSFLRARLGD